MKESVARQTRNNPIKGTHCFLGQETLLLVGFRNRFKRNFTLKLKQMIILH